MKYFIGIDMGGTKIAAGLTNENFELLIKDSIPTGAKRESDEITKDIAELCRRVCEKKGISLSDVAGIGIAAPGAIDTDKGTIEYSCNLPFREYNMEKALSALTGCPVKIANDANAAALGEAVAGASKGSRSSVMITLGTGLGGGIILDGKILCGVNGAAGELGHVVIEKDGLLCPCGRRGCFEAYSSATGLVKMTKEAIAEAISLDRPTLMREMTKDDINNASPRTSWEAYKKGDEAAKEVIDKYISYLACGITNLINTFQPEMLIIGGGLSGEKNYLLDPLLPIVERDQYTRANKNKCVLKIATLGNDAGMIGAAALTR